MRALKVAKKKWKKEKCLETDVIKEKGLRVRLGDLKSTSISHAGVLAHEQGPPLPSLNVLIYKTRSLITPWRIEQ